MKSRLTEAQPHQPPQQPPQSHQGSSAQGNSGGNPQQSGPMSGLFMLGLFENAPRGEEEQEVTNPDLRAVHEIDPEQVSPPLGDDSSEGSRCE